MVQKDFDQRGKGETTREKSVMRLGFPTLKKTLKPEKGRGPPKNPPGKSSEGRN